MARRSIHGEHKSLTRRLLIEAALEKFNDLGYHATRIEDIVGAAGASRSTFHLHFEGKIDVVHELIAVVEPEAEAIFARFDDADHVSWEGLRDTIAEFVDAIAVDREAEAVTNPRSRASRRAWRSTSIANGKKNTTTRGYAQRC